MKKFLERNKIYIDALLPLAVFLFTLTTYFTTQELAKLQLTVAKTAIEPIFSLESEYKTLKGKYVEEHMLIKNFGPAVNNLDSNISTFVQVEYGESANRSIVRIPVNAYFFVTQRIRNHDKILFEHYGHNNHLLFTNFYTEALDYEGSQRPIFVSLIHFTAISYLNSINERNTTYFINKERQVINDEALQWIEIHSKTVKLIDINDLKLERILTHINEITKSGEIVKFKVQKE